MFYDRERMRAAFDESQYHGCWFVAANLAYDLCNLYGNQIPIELCLVGRNLYFGRRQVTVKVIRTPKRTYESPVYVHFADVLRQCPSGSVRKLGEWLGLPKIDTGGRHPEDMPLEEAVAYCGRDSEITCRFAHRLQDTYHDLGCEYKYTLGSSALDLWRRKYQTRPYIRLDESTLMHLAQAYYGGRCEAFEIGELKDGPFYFGDFKSMYPSVMRDLPLPIASREHCFECSCPGSWALDYEGVSRVTVHHPDMTYPVLPYRHPQTNKLLFPVGTFTGYWTHLELRYALSLGVRILRYHYTVYFDAVESTLAPMMERLYALRSDGPWQNIVGKLLSNNLSGKYAQNRPPGRLLTPEAFELLRYESTEDIQATQVYRDDTDTPIAYLVEETNWELPKHTNFVWSAYITAGARIKLHRAGAPLRMIYCDTDSILTRTPLTTSTALGSLDLKEVTQACTILAPKAYETDESCRVKGVPRHQGWYEALPGQYFPTDDLQSMALAGFKVFYDAPLKLFESFTRTGFLPRIEESVDGECTYNKDAIRASPNIWHVKSKVLTGESDKRIILPGGRTKPLRIQE